MALSLPNTIENDSPADASEVQQNFTAIQSHVNTNVIDRNGSVSMNQALTLVGDPTQPNHAANKDYVDDVRADATAALVAGPQTVTTWTPVTFGLTVGNGVHTCYYLKNGRQCTISYYFVFGSTSELPGTGAGFAFQITLPFTALNWSASGLGYVLDASVPASWPINISLETKDLIDVNYFGTADAGTASSTAAFYRLGAGTTWSVNDLIAFEMTYLTAT